MSGMCRMRAHAGVGGGEGGTTIDSHSAVLNSLHDVGVVEVVAVGVGHGLGHGIQVRLHATGLRWMCGVGLW